jgi:DNA-binding protein HU-beta
LNEPAHHWRTSITAHRQHGGTLPAFIALFRKGSHYHFGPRQLRRGQNALETLRVRDGGPRSQHEWVRPPAVSVILSLHRPGFPITPSRTMAKTLTKSEIALSLAESVGVTKKQAIEALEALVALAYKNAKNKFTIPGLGKLVLVNRKARMGRNPATGASIKIPAKRVVKFRIAKAAKDAILGTK